MTQSSSAPYRNAIEQSSGHVPRPAHLSLLVIGIGNEFRGDDGVGIAVARRLAAHACPQVRIVETDGASANLLELWEGAACVIVVDAVRSGAPPGTIHRFDGRTALPPARFFYASTHALGVAEAIGLARALKRLPPSLIVYGIEGKQFDSSLTLSPEVQIAVEQVVEEILAFQRHAGCDRRTTRT